MLSLGTKAKDFVLFDTTYGKDQSFHKVVDEKPFMVMFICNHCPFVIHLHEGIQKMVSKYGGDIQIVAISSNDVNDYPQDSPDLMKELFDELKLDVPYFYDETQDVAKEFEAACTPDFYLFNTSKELVYRGQFDDSRPGNDIPVTGKDLFTAMDNLLQNKLQEVNQKPSLGCNIKWK